MLKKTHEVSYSMNLAIKWILLCVIHRPPSTNRGVGCQFGQILRIDLEVFLTTPVICSDRKRVTINGQKPTQLFIKGSQHPSVSMVAIK